MYFFQRRAKLIVTDKNRSFFKHILLKVSLSGISVITDKENQCLHSKFVK